MRAFAPLLCTVLISGAAAAQTPTPKSTPVPSSGVTLTTGTQLVVVDVSVEDHDGHPIHGLQRTDFQLLENKKPEAIKTFDEHAANDPAHPKTPLPAMPKLPPGVFTDYTQVASDSTLNVLLLDALNTPMKDQTYVRYQLQQYVKKANPGTRIAIIGLTSRLIILQGFTSDPEVLKAAVEHKLIPRASVLLDDPSGSNTDPNLLSDTMAQAGLSATTVADMQQFEAESASFQTQNRTRYTLDAFNALARYLGTFPGRKNLIWFSGSFPLNIFADPTINDPFAVVADSADDLRQTTTLLDRARVAVYPVDARGLQSQPMFDASRSGKEYAGNPGRMGRDISNFSSTNAAEHATMDQIADDTGGHAFYNTNGLAEAVAKIIDTGSNYYTLTYNPSNHDFKGDFRSIRVNLEGAAAARGLKLSYRRGYYAQNPNSPKAVSAILSAAPPSTPTVGSRPYAQQAMQRGAPTPSEILFKVLVRPDAATPEDKIAEHNTPDPAHPMNGPYRRYDISFATLAGDLTLPRATDGIRHGGVEFVAFVYDPEGRLLNIEHNTVTMNLEPQTYASLMKSGLQFNMQISAPARGESFLRLGVRDTTSGRMGVVEIPTTSVERLPPLPKATPTPAPASTPK